MSSESPDYYREERYNHLFDSLSDDFFVVLNKFFKLSIVWKLNIKKYVVSIMKLLHMKEECIIPSLLVLEKYSSAFSHYSGDALQFVGMGLLVGWKMVNNIGGNEEFCQGKDGAAALSLIQNSGKKPVEELEIEFLRDLEFNVSIPAMQFLRIGKKIFALNKLVNSCECQLYDENSALVMEAMSKNQSKIFEEIYHKSAPTKSPSKPPMRSLPSSPPKQPITYNMRAE